MVALFHHIARLQEAFLIKQLRCSLQGGDTPSCKAVCTCMRHRYFHIAINTLH